MDILPDTGLSLPEITAALRDLNAEEEDRIARFARSRVIGRFAASPLTDLRRRLACAGAAERLLDRLTPHAALLRALAHPRAPAVGDWALLWGLVAGIEPDRPVMMRITGHVLQDDGVTRGAVYNTVPVAPGEIVAVAER